MEFFRNSAAACGQETGQRKHRASLAIEKLALCTIDKFDFSKPEWTSNIVEAGLDHRRCRSWPVTQAHTRDS